MATAELKTFPVRLTDQANELLRTAYHYRGDLSAQLLTICEAVDLRKIDLLKFPTGRAAAKANGEDRPTKKTSIRIPLPRYDGIKGVADERGTSVNALLNSAVLAALGTL
jgi:hypothetical protein